MISCSWAQFGNHGLGNWLPQSSATPEEIEKYKQERAAKEKAEKEKAAKGGACR